jgi:hypothetical protein
VNRDAEPTPAETVMITSALLAAARGAMAVPYASPADAVAAVRAAVGCLWPGVPPEAARDTMVLTAELACGAGVRSLPEGITDQAAADMLELTAEWIAAGEPEPESGRFTPPYAYASSTAFDRGEDDATLTTVAVLLVLAEPAAYGEPAEPEEPERPEDDERGQS